MSKRRKPYLVKDGKRYIPMTLAQIGWLAVKMDKSAKALDAATETHNSDAENYKQAVADYRLYDEGGVR